MSESNPIPLLPLFNTMHHEILFTWLVTNSLGNSSDSEQALFFSKNGSGGQLLEFYMKLNNVQNLTYYSVRQFLEHFADLTIIVDGNELKNSTGEVNVTPAFNSPTTNIDTNYKVSVVIPGESPTRVSQPHSKVEIRLCSKTAMYSGVGEISIKQSRLPFSSSLHTERSRLGRIQKYFYWDKNNVGNSTFSLEESFLLDPSQSGFYNFSLTPMATKMNLSGTVTYGFSNGNLLGQLSTEITNQLTTATKHLDTVAIWLNKFYDRLNKSREQVTFNPANVNRHPDLLFDFNELMPADAAAERDGLISIGNRIMTNENSWIWTLAHEFGHMLGLPHQDRHKMKSLMTYDNIEGFQPLDVYILNEIEAEDAHRSSS
ncbi:hypothetical protein KDD30_19950 (plasmid) [Photobacterium sp. GJ3]|uniref:hypothetical protein n=1 Tax=Photobacterium sp. GJ3 TaxID=2829502 RepID=UPI001B8B62B6|nr:hypothetical protein [Photobacterium sp. GJ3]QUJ70385.1 hypothetical protein KDD30_19950 [Photobacterium sp. GJ3]